MRLGLPRLLCIGVGVLALLALSAPALAATWTVGPSGANFTAIQAAIDHADPGDTVLVEAGTYAEAIAIDKSLDLIGSGMPAIDATGLPIAVQVNASGVRLDGFAVSGAVRHALILEGTGIAVTNCSFEYDGAADAGVAVGGSSVEDVRFEHNLVTCTGAPGLLVTDPKGLTIRDNRIQTQGGDGITLRFEEAGDYPGIAIVDNALDTPGGWGIYVTSTYGASAAPRVLAPSIIGNRVVRADAGISVDGAERAVIERNRVESCGLSGEGEFGILLRGGQGSVVRENVVRDSNLSTGIRFHGANFEDERSGELEIVDNRVTNNSEVGMELYGITDSVLRGNIMERNRYNFHYRFITTTAPNMTIDATNLVDGRPILHYEGKSGVHLGAADRPGMVFFFDCRDVSVADAEFRNTVGGITLYRTEDATIRNCTFASTAWGVEAIDVNGGSITGCRGTDVLFGIELDETGEMTVDHNVFATTHGAYGIVVNDPEPGMRIGDNAVSGFMGGLAAIFVEAGDRLVVENNTLGDGEYGAMLLGAYNVSVTGNRMAGGRIAGVVLSGSADTTITGNRIEANTVGLVLNPMGAPGGENVIVNNHFNNTVQVSSSLPSEPDDDSADRVLSPLVRSVREAGQPFPSIVEEELNRTVREFQDRTADADPVSPSPNVWNLSKSTGPNIVGGPYLGGNYWASPNGTGWSETHADRGDGFCAEPFVIDENNVDALPLHLHSGPSPYVTHAVPCRIEAEDYDVNGYSDRTPGNTGGQYRHDDVDIEKGGSNYDVGWVKSSEWLEYTIQVDRTGLYAATLRTATPWFGRMILLSVDGKAAGVVAVPQTGSFAKYTTVGATLPLTAGTHHLRLRFVSDGQNLDFIDLAPVKEANFAATPTSGPRSLRVSFTDQSTGTPVKWQWSFGDGKYSTSTVRNPTWYYNRAGTYSVTLKVTYADGTTRTVTRPNLIRVG